MIHILIDEFIFINGGRDVIINQILSSTASNPDSGIYTNSTTL